MKNSVKKLIKDLAIAVITGVVFYFIWGATGETYAVYPAVMCAGFWFGWTSLSKYFVSLGWISLLIKFVLAIFVGWVLLLIGLVKDIIAIVQEK